MRQIKIILAGLTFALGLVALLVSTGPAIAQPVNVTPLPPVTGTDGRAGACYSFYPDPQTERDRPFLTMTVSAGSRWDRFDFSWPAIEPHNDAWSFGPHETLVNDLHNSGIQNIVGILLWTPPWAATQAGALGAEMLSFDRRPFGWYAPIPRALMAPQAVSAASSPPQGLYLAWDNPNNHWGNYVYTVVSHFGDQVKYWEMWNEPEWNYFWSGTSTDYTQLLKVGYQATKAACPDCKVLFGGLHYWANRNYYRWVLSQINQDSQAPQNNYFFDIMSVHLYSRSSSIYDEIANIRSGMTTYHVGDHPIWLTETGVPVWGDPQAPNPKYDYAATQDEAAAYLIQSYANAWAAGVERYFFFRTNDADMGECFGLIRNDRSLRPAYVAYQVAATYLISPTFVTRSVSAPNVNVTLWGTPRGKVSVLWNASPTDTVYTLPAALPTATLVYSRGVTQTIAATNNAYTFTLPGATANLVSNPADYFIGGDPLIVIESETVNRPPTSTVRPLPEVTYTPAFTVTWEGQDNESGVWLYDVQVRDGESGEWILWRHSAAVTSGVYTGTHGRTYYFRSRATDRVGNRGDWPTGPQAWTTLDLSSTLRLTVGPFFADENRNDVRDTPITETGEITLTGVSLRFLDGVGHDVVSPTVGNTWAFTTPILAGQSYRLQAVATAAMTTYLRTVPFVWPQGRQVYTETLVPLGLWPARRVYMPLVLRK